MRVLIFGDSITQGYWDSQGGWVQRLRKHYDQKYLENPKIEQPSLFNLGISADTTQNVLNRFIAETEARKRHGDLAFIFSIGLNDSQLDNDKPVSSPEQYRIQLGELVNQAQQYSDKIVFVGLSPCDESKTVPVSWGNIVYTNSRIQEFDDVLEEFCNQHGLSLVKSFNNLSNEHLPDGLHPNNTGHQIIADLVQPELQRVLQ